MPEIIKQPENYTALTKAEEHRNLRAHLLMMLEAMQYKGNTKFMGNEALRDLVEKEKVTYLRRLQGEIEKEHIQKFGVSVHERPQQTS